MFTACLQEFLIVLEFFSMPYQIKPNLGVTPDVGSELQELSLVAVAFLESRFSAPLQAYRRARQLADLRDPPSWFARKQRPSLA